MSFLQVTDKLFVGGNDVSVVPHGEDYSVNYEFACMSSVTGLFKEQLADGILGLSRFVVHCLA